MKNHPLSMVVFHQPACMQGIRSPGILVHFPMGKRSSTPNRLLAGAGGIEPTLKVLETFVLPLYDAPIVELCPQDYIIPSKETRGPRPSELCVLNLRCYSRRKTVLCLLAPSPPIESLKRSPALIWMVGIISSNH